MPESKQEPGRFRAFLAIDIPSGVKDRISAITGELDDSFVRPVSRDNLHVTLLFLGDIDSDMSNRVMRMMDTVDDASFDVSLAGMGSFPEDFPNVIFVNVTKGADRMSRIYDTLCEGASSIGIRIENRRFTPHITIGRVKRHNSNIRMRLLDFIDEHSLEDFGGFRCNNIALKKSVLTENGPIYEDIYRDILHP